MPIDPIREGDIPGVQLRCRHELAAAPAEAWTWLTEPARQERWLCRQATAEGESLVWRGVDERGAARIEAARIVESDPPRLLGLLFERRGAGWTTETRLLWELAATAEGCELSVLQGGFQNLPLSIGLTVWEEYRRRWRTALERLAEEIRAAR